MDTPNTITLPKKRQTRTLVFGIRLTHQERETIRAFARQINFPASEMARHFVLQAVAYHSARLAEKGSAMQSSPEAIEEQSQERQIDLVSIYRTVLRVVAHLEESDYNGGNSRQADVLKHDDLPDPASRVDNPQG